MLYPFLLAVPLGYFLYRTDAYDITKNYLTEKYDKWKSLNSLVETQHKNPVKIFTVSMSMVCKMWWINFLQKIDKSIESIDKNRVAITYVLDGRIYKFLTKRRKGPALVLLVTDQEENDVSEQVLPYLGPARDWHGHVFRPDFWDKDKLTFELSTGESRSFSRQDEIDLV